ncbi:monocarboxylate transporter 12-like [Haemaphysalis longicornis]
MAQPDSRACLPVVASAAIFVFFAMAITRAEPVMFVGFMEMLQIDRTAASWPLTVAVIMSQLGGALYGVLGFWFSQRALLIMGGLLCSLPVMACGLTKSFILILFLYGVLAGLGVACEEVVPYAVVARHFVRYRGAAMSVLFVSAALSGVVSPRVVQALRSAFGFQTALFLIGALELNTLLGCIVINRVALPKEGDSVEHGRSHDSMEAENPATEPHAPSRRPEMSMAPIAQPVSEEHVDPVITARAAPSANIPPEARSRWSKLARELRSLASAQFLLLAASRAVSLLVMVTLVLTAVDFGMDIGLGDNDAVYLAQANAAGDVVARITTGIVLDLKLLSGGSLMLSTFASETVTLVVMSLVKHHWILLTSYFVSGLSEGCRIITTSIMVADMYQDDVLQLSLGVVNFVAGVVVLVRPLLVGLTRDATGSYIPLWATFAVITIAFTVTWAATLCSQRFRGPGETETEGVAGAYL